MTDDNDSRLGRIEGKLDGLIYSSDKHYDRMNRIDKNVEDAHKRMNAIERKLWAVSGGIAVVAALAVAFIKKLFN